MGRYRVYIVNGRWIEDRPIWRHWKWAVLAAWLLAALAGLWFGDVWFNR